MNISYTYTVLRYVHDITTDEFVNVGVALYAPKARFASAICRDTYGRLSKVFPGISGKHFRSLMRHIQSSFEKLGRQLKSELPLGRQPQSISELAHSVLPMDDSALQWSPAGAGLTEDPAATLSQLYDRMVMPYEEKPAKAHRTEDDVWRQFKTALEDRQMLERFEPKTITVEDDAVEFQHTWTNGILHCLEPVSFDMSTPDNIRDKAHQWLGRMTSVQSSEERFQVYFLVGGPAQRHSLLHAYDNAVSILKKSPGNNVVLKEEQAEELSGLLAQEISRFDA